MLWSAIKTRELANVAGDHLADVADAAERGNNRVCEEDRLPWSFLAHTPGWRSTLQSHTTNEKLSKRFPGIPVRCLRGSPAENP